MFCGCSSQQKLNIDSFINNNVLNMRYMFAGYSQLKQLNLENFNTNNVTNMNQYESNVRQMFKIEAIKS